MRIYRRFLFILSLLFLTASLAFAQDSDAWTMKERCLPEATAAPEDWTFEGTILAYSGRGIHGINANWETRRILAYRPNKTVFDWLPPDARTWITMQGNSACSSVGCTSADIMIDRMTIHNLAASIPEYRTIDWSFYTLQYSRVSLALSYVPILRWLSPYEFIYTRDLDGNSYSSGTSVLFNIRTDETEIYDSAIESRYFHYISPDGTRAVDYDLADGMFLINPQDENYQVRLPEGFIPLFTTLNFWSPSSQYFVAMKQEEILDTTSGKTNYSIWLVNRDGQDAFSFLKMPLSSNSYIRLSWSPNEKFLIFSLVGSGGGINNSAWLADFQAENIYNLCLDELHSAVWSPDSSQLALQIWDEPLTIFEPDTWSRYLIDNNSDVRVWAWRSEE